MPYDKHHSRRNFIKQSSLGVGAGIVGITAPFNSGAGEQLEKMPREISVASIDLKGLWPDTTMESRVNAVLDRMNEVTGIHPDILCLPELFSTIWVDEKRLLSEVAEDERVPGPVASRIAAFAKKHRCYVVCPIYTRSQGAIYNSSLLIDRAGAIAGVYHKTHPVKTEIIPEDGPNNNGVLPGAIDQPVIETDFGRVGMQICYDANWPDGWDNLKTKGADLVLFSSAFPGGRMLNYYALNNNYYVVSSTGGDARVIDISGNDLDITSDFVRYAWATVHLDRVNAPTWPTRDKLPALFKKYGNRVRVKVWGNTDVITLESRQPGLRISDVLKEFGIITKAALLEGETDVQNKYRIEK